MTGPRIASADQPALWHRTHESPYVLRQLEVYNWGPFSGMHRVGIDPRGTAVIGPTGSGKTTLIDALMTLLVLQPRYNLASTGGIESDRTLISYVRGFLGADGAIDGDEVARPGNVHSAVCGTYQSDGGTLKLSAILWADGASNAAQDLKRRWIFSQAEGESLEQWLRLLSADGARHLMRHGRETAQLRIFESKKAYLAHVRQFFDVSENAFTLLNRAAGLKQLTSIDEILRELVLDDRSAFDRALEVAAEFDNLAAIHAELETARRQQESLDPIRRESVKLARAQSEMEALTTLKRVLPIWFGMVGEQRWAAEEQRLAEACETCEANLRQESRRRDACERQVDTLREHYLQLGGNVISELQNTIDDREQRVAERCTHADDYQRVVAGFGLDTALDEPTLVRNQQRLGHERKALMEHLNAKDGEALDARSKLRDVIGNCKQTEETLRRVRERPGSNIPPRFQDFRGDLGEQIGLDEHALPFVAELIEVKPEEHSWRGAIERALGGERLRILVPESHIEAALRWVNDRHNRLHVRLLRASTDERPSEFLADGFTRKLTFKPHPLRESLKRLLASRDRHCVESPEALEHTDHGMTADGLMSGRDGRFEKQDQRPLSEGWLTGFDNRDQLRALEDELSTLARTKRQSEELADRLQQEWRALDERKILIDRLCTLEFSTIDLPGAQASLDAAKERLELLLRPDSDASRAKAEFDRAKQELGQIEGVIKEIEKKIAVLDSKRHDAVTKRAACAERAGDGLSEPEAELASQQIVISADASVESLDDAEREHRERLELKLDQGHRRIEKLGQGLVRHMEAAQRVDTGALAETGTELEDIPDYLERLQVLEKESLPAYLDRFRDYLNRSSDQGVTQLLASIAEEVDDIEHRITELNLTLAKVEFQAGRHLRLQPTRIRHERLRALETAQKRLRSAALVEDLGESHFKALRSVIEVLREAGDNRRLLGSRALLDPRYRLEFSVVIVDSETGETSAPRAGSQSGSGGEKELMASHILTAALSYALCPTEASHPLYGTVVLDEAFSKSSPSAAGRIIEALRIFGLHPIFVTPNKEIGLLKRHTNRAICVQRRGREASLAAISWEKLDEIAAESRPPASRP